MSKLWSQCSKRPKLVALPFDRFQSRRQTCPRTESRETFATRLQGDRKLCTRNCASHSKACSWYWLPFRDLSDAVLFQEVSKSSNSGLQNWKLPSEWAALCILLSSSPLSGIRVEVAGSFSFFSNGLLAITQSHVDSCVTVYNGAQY